MPTIFERIVRGDVPAHRLWEDERHLVFLDVNPRVPGHTLVIPKHPYPELFAMPEEEYSELWQVARRMAHHLKERTGCARVITVVVGYEVPHVHIHLLPTDSLQDFPFPPVDEAARRRLAETAQELAV